MTIAHRLRRAWRALWQTGPTAEVAVVEGGVEVRVWLRGREHLRRHPVSGDGGLMFGIASADQTTRQVIGLRRDPHALE